MKTAMLVIFSLLISKFALADSYVSMSNTPVLSDPQKTQIYISTATGASKGTVVLLHGFVMISPDIYQELINDLTTRGYDVIFPQYQEAGPGIVLSIGLLGLIGFDGATVNHDKWTDNACEGIRWGLRQRLPYLQGFSPVLRKPSDRLFVFGHSIGGAIGYNLANRCTDVGDKIQGMVLANAILDPTKLLDAQNSPLPMPVPQTINLKYAGVFNAFPILFLTGEQDAWGNPNQGQEFLDAAIKSPDKRILVAKGPDANHLAPTTNSGAVGDLLTLLGVMNSIGGKIVHNNLDTKYYSAAILHLLSGGLPSTFTSGVATQ